VYPLRVIEKEVFSQFRIKLSNVIKEEVGMVVNILSLEYPIEPFTMGIHLGSTGIGVGDAAYIADIKQSREVFLEL